MNGDELPAGWRWRKLGEVTAEDRHPTDNISLPYLGLDAIEANTGRIIESKEPPGSALTFFFDQRHILYGKLRPCLNKIAIPTSTGRCTTEAIPLLPSSEIDRRFVAWFLRSPASVRAIVQSTTGSRMPRADMRVVNDLSMPVPPLPEQRRIADAIDAAMAEAEAAARVAEAQRKYMAEIGQGYANSLIDDLADAHGCVRLDRLAPARDAFRDGPFGSNLKTAHYPESGARVVRLQNVGDGEFLEQHLVYISLTHFDTIRTHEAIAGDVIVAALGDGARSAGRACVMPKLDTPAVVKADCFRIRPPSSTLRSKFLVMGLNSSFVRTQLTSQLRGATRPRVNLDMLRAVSFPAVPINLQDRAIEQMERIDAEIASARVALMS